MSLSNGLWLISIRSFQTLNQSSMQQGVEFLRAGGPTVRGPRSLPLFPSLSHAHTLTHMYTHTHTHTYPKPPSQNISCTLHSCLSFHLHPLPLCRRPPPNCLCRANGELAFFHSFTFVLVNPPHHHQHHTAPPSLSICWYVAHH